MRILFVTQQATSGIGIVRAVWPAWWINKYTDHAATVIDERDLAYSDAPSLLESVDVVVIHQASSALYEYARKAAGKGIPVVFDTDDYNERLYDQYRIIGYMQEFVERTYDTIALSKAVTCSSHPLADRLEKHGRPVHVVDNGYDYALDNYNIHHEPYYQNSQGEWIKIVYGGSTGHARDIAMFLDLGVIEALKDYRIDWHFYGVVNGPAMRRNVSNTSTVFFSPGADITEYIQKFYADASALIAPLVIDEFNHCRSRIKPVEAGIVGIPAIVSNVESYRGFSDGTVCVENTAEDWVRAITSVIEDKDRRAAMGRENRAAAREYHNARYLTQRRIEVYESVI